MFKRHYNIVVISCCFLFMFVNVGLASTAFSVHQPYIVSMDGIGDGSGSIIIATNKLMAILAMFAVERFYNVFGYRKGVFLATVLIFIGFMVYSCATTVAGFMLGSVFTGFGYGLGGMVAVTYIINRFFESGIGTAIGIASVGSGLCAIFMPYLITYVIHQASLAAAFHLEALIALVIGLLVFMALRDKPEDLGLKRFASKKADKRRSISQSHMHTPSRFDQGLLFVALVGVGFFSSGGSAYISVLATSNGFAPMLAASLVSTIGIAMTIGKIGIGEIMDKAGISVGTLLIFGVGICGYALCSTAPLGNPYLLVFGALCLGIGMVSGSVGLSVWSIAFSTPQKRSKEIRNFQICFQSGSFLVSLIPGFIMDIFGTYVISYAGMGIIGLFAFAVIFRYHHKYNRSSVQE